MYASHLCAKCSLAGSPSHCLSAPPCSFPHPVVSVYGFQDLVDAPKAGTTVSGEGEDHHSADGQSAASQSVSPASSVASAGATAPASEQPPGAPVGEVSTAV